MRILMRAGRSPFAQMAPEVALEGFPAGAWGGNVGNLIFSDSIHRLLSTPSTTIDVDGFSTQTKLPTHSLIHGINKTYDHLVIPLANAFRPSFAESLHRLTTLISKVDIPVTVVGVGIAGGRGSLAEPVPAINSELASEVDRFMRAVLDRGPSIGVRGEFTAEFLRRLGYGPQFVRTIGCPSLYKYGPDLHVENRLSELTTDSAISLNLTHYVPEMGEISLHNCKAYKHLTYIAQVTPDTRLLMWGEDVPNVRSKKMPTHVRHPLYLNDKMLFFTDGTSWTRYLATRDFVFGSRIHGNIAAIISGTPAIVLTHDARTLELARFHNLPHIEVPKLDGRIDAREFFELADFDAFNSCQRENFAGFADFLREHRISHVYEPGQENPSYDARISALPTIPAIRALTSKDASAQRAAYARLAESRGPDFRRQMVRLGKAALDPKTPEGGLSGRESAAVGAGPVESVPAGACPPGAVLDGTKPAESRSPGQVDVQANASSQSTPVSKRTRVTKFERATRRLVKQVGAKLQRMAEY